MAWLFSYQRSRSLSIAPLISTLLWLTTPSIGSKEPPIPASGDVKSSLASLSVASQTSSQSRLMRQGNQIALNGRILPAAWSQWQLNSRGTGSGASSSVRTGISDAGLMQTVGLELLNTWDVKRQPVQWFSQPTAQSLVLGTRLTHQYRYLDITDFASTVGWRLLVDGATLRIDAPVGRVKDILQSPYPGSNFSSQQDRNSTQPTQHRIIVDLDRPTPWQVNQQGQEWILTINAAVDPAIAQRFRSNFPANSPLEQTEDTEGEGTTTPSPAVFSAIQVESAQNQTIIRANIPANWRPLVRSVPNPSRLVVDIQPSIMVERDIAWAPGIRWRQKYLSLGTSRFPVTWLEINLRQPGLTLKPIWTNPNSLVGIAPLLQTAQQLQVAAAINGGFFNRDTHLPLGAIRRDGRWLSSPILNRGAIAWNDAGEIKMGRLSLQETLITSTNERLPIVSLNSGYVQRGISLHTPSWGTTYAPLTNNETIVVVQNNRITAQFPGVIAGQTVFPMPPNGYLIAIRDYPAAADLLTIGTTVRYDSVPIPTAFSRYPQIIGAGPLLLENRQVVLNAKAEQFRNAFIQQAAIRSAIGRTQNGTLAIAAVHNRIGGKGPTLGEMAALMKLLGAVDALNLDGGSSTSLYLGGQLLDRPPRTAARVHNSLGIFLRPNF